MTSVPDARGATASRLDRRRAKRLAGALVVIGAITVWRIAANRDGAIHDFVGPTMGTTYAVRVDAGLTATERQRVGETIQAKLDEIDGLMSTFDSTSELSGFNRHESTEPYPVSRALMDVLVAARLVSVRSGGALDVTIAPLVDAWGFGPVWPLERVPDADRLEQLRGRVGFDRLLLDPEASTVSKTVAGVVVDLSAIAKGYAVDEVAEELGRLGLTSFLVEVGGEVRAGEPKRDGTPWTVGIEAPDLEARRLHATLGLVDRAMATSGDYRNFFEEDGIRYAHLIDPRSGMPVRYTGSSVTVVHDDGAMADAWATALSVLGPEEGFALALSEDVAALFVMRSSDGIRPRVTPSFLEAVVDLTEVESR